MISQEILLVKARERAYENLEYNRLNNRVTYRDLLHQVTKKKKIWPVRKVIAEFKDEVFQLMPCWMASPESVSAIFPMEQVFDVVIFDEASQCFTERGIPAMYRGKQIVIAGDDNAADVAAAGKLGVEGGVDLEDNAGEVEAVPIPGEGEHGHGRPALLAVHFGGDVGEDGGCQVVS